MRKILLPVLALLIFAGCIFTPEQPGADYSIFSHLPSNGTTGAMLININGSGFQELSSVLGSVMGGNLIKKLGGAKIAVVSYENGDSAGLVELKTNLSWSDILDSIPTSMSSEYVNETRGIGGKDVTLIYQKYDSSKANPICVWNEGEFLDVMYYQKGFSSYNYEECTFPAGISCMSYNLSESKDLYLKIGQGTGHTIKINSAFCTSNYGEYNYNTYNESQYNALTNPVTLDSGSYAEIVGGSSGNSLKCTGSSSGGYFSGWVYIGYTEVDTGLSRLATGSLSIKIGSQGTEEKRCDKMLEKTYDTSVIAELLNESVGMRANVPTFDNSMGEGFVYLENQSMYVSAFKDDDADYAVIVRKLKEGNNLCYNDSYSGGSANVISRGAEKACVKKSGGSLLSYLPGGVKIISVERRVGDNSMMIYAYVTGSEKNAETKAEDTVFSLNFPGEEVSWTDKMTLTVDVYEIPKNNMEEMPVADAKVEVYNYSYSYAYNGGEKSTPIETAYTDDKGIAKFSDMSISSYSITVTKDGYRDGTGWVYAPETNSSIMLQPIQPIRVTVEESSSEGSYGGRTPVGGARVDLYNSSYSYYGSGYELLATKYTDDYGVADFGKMDISNGKVVVNKDGYNSDTEYVTEYSSDITAYISKSYENYNNYYNYTGEPFMITVKGYSSSGTYLSSIAGAKVDIYNETPTSTYVLAMTNYTDSSGVAMLNGMGIVNGMINVGKEGYGNYSEYFYSYNTRNMMVYLSEVKNYNKTIGNATADYPIVQAEGSGCISPSKEEEPPAWIIGPPDGNGACFWETEPLFGTFGKTITFYKLNLTVFANSVSVNKPLEVLTSNSSSCYEEALGGNFAYYTLYATFTPDVAGSSEASSFKGYVVSNGTVSARCIAIKDMTHDGYGYIIDSVRVYQ